MSLAAIALALVSGSLRAAANENGATQRIAIVVAESWELSDSIRIKDLRALYLGKRSALKKKDLTPWQLTPGDPVRDQFNQQVLEKTESALSEYWLKQALIGEATAPKSAISQDQMLRNISRYSGAIGYVSYDELVRNQPSGIKVLSVLVNGKKQHPSDSDYVLAQQRLNR